MKSADLVALEGGPSNPTPFRDHKRGAGERTSFGLAGLSKHFWQNDVGFYQVQSAKGKQILAHAPTYFLPNWRGPTPDVSVPTHPQRRAGPPSSPAASKR